MKPVETERETRISLSIRDIWNVKVKFSRKTTFDPSGIGLPLG